jgi:GNAT superfamily N-acetyltransferase
MEIRGYLPQDRDAVRDICKMTAVGSFSKDETKKEQICLLFLDYFLDYEPEHTFVAVSENAVVGYICGSMNKTLFRDKMRSVYDKRLRKTSFVLFLFSRLSTRLSFPLYRKYGCSMHMNVAPAFQHRGIGVKLLNALKKHCEANGNKGIFLVTRNRRTTGYPFYLSQGFKVCPDFLFGSLALCYAPSSKDK